jgi:DNA-binding NarL/FixJ family response regulator
MHESDRTVREVLEAGGQGYVLKSDLANYLVKAVKAVFRGEIFLTPRVSKIVLEGFVKTGKEFGSGQISENGPTAREIEIIRLLGSGKANKEVAQELGITVRTVETHRRQLCVSLGFIPSLSFFIMPSVKGFSPPKTFDGPGLRHAFFCFPLNPVRNNR